MTACQSLYPGQLSVMNPLIQMRFASENISMRQHAELPLRVAAAAWPRYADMWCSAAADSAESDSEPLIYSPTQM
jgi:hypothetical protein